MIAKILASINKGACTEDMLAQKLSTSKNMIVASLEFMVHEGYLEETSCENKSLGCPLKCSIPIPVRMYAITQKGITHLKNEGMYK